MTTTDTALNALLLDQIETHWNGQLRPRLEGLTDAEYYWEPTPGAWGLHPRGEAHTELTGGSGDVVVDFAMPAPDPAPVTTIGWRLAHLVVGVLGARVHGHFGGPEVDYPTFDYAATADGALAQLDEAYAAWLAGVRGWSDEELAQPCGPAEGPWADERPGRPRAAHQPRADPPRRGDRPAPRPVAAPRRPADVVRQPESH